MSLTHLYTLRWRGIKKKDGDSYCPSRMWVLRRGHSISVRSLAIKGCGSKQQAPQEGALPGTPSASHILQHSSCPSESREGSTICVPHSTGSQTSWSHGPQTLLKIIGDNTELLVMRLHPLIFTILELKLEHLKVLDNSFKITIIKPSHINISNFTSS